MDTSTTRRGVLGVMTAIPALALPAISALAWSSEWDGAKSAYLAADLAVKEHDRVYLTPVSERWTATRKQWPIDYDFKSDPAATAALDAISVDYDPVQARFDDLVDQEADAYEAMMRAPAPNMAAVHYKLRSGLDGDMTEHLSGGQLATIILADLERLASARP